MGDVPDREALRRRLYGPDASPEDVAAYEATAGPADVQAEPEGPGAEAARHGRGRGRTAAMAAIGVVLVLGGLLLGHRLITGVVQAGTTAASAAPTTTTSRIADQGAGPYAEGAATREGRVRVLYTVAAGDTIIGIAARFGLCTGDVLVALPYGFDPSDLPSGQSLQLQRSSARAGRTC